LKILGAGRLFHYIYFSQPIGEKDFTPANLQTPKAIGNYTENKFGFEINKC
jgi:hypothetical protein